MALYHGEKLNYRPAFDGIAVNFFGDAALWITHPEQRNLPYMIFAGGLPNEWCIPLKNLPVNELKQLISDNPNDESLLSDCNEILQKHLPKNF